MLRILSARKYSPVKVCKISFIMLPEKKSREHTVAGLSVRPSVSPSVRQSVRTSHSCPAHNFVTSIWSWISKLLYRNEHHVKIICRAQHLGRYLEGKGHSIWSRISKLFHRVDNHIETACRAYYLDRYVEGQGHCLTLQQNRVRPITLLFEVRFRNNYKKWSPYWVDV